MTHNDPDGEMPLEGNASHQIHGLYPKGQPLPQQDVCLVFSPLYDTSTHIEAQKLNSSRQATKTLAPGPQGLGIWSWGCRLGNIPLCSHFTKSKSFGHLAAERLQFHSGEHLLEPDLGRVTLGMVPLARFSKMTAAII